MWNATIDIINKYYIGDLASIAGLGVALIGFTATLINVFRSKKAAEQAREYAAGMKKYMSQFDATKELTESISILSEIKRLMAKGDWKNILEKFINVRIKVVGIKESLPDLQDEQKTLMQSVIQSTRIIEGTIAYYKENEEETEDSKKLYLETSKIIDKLQKVQFSLREISGGN